MQVRPLKQIPFLHGGLKYRSKSGSYVPYISDASSNVYGSTANSTIWSWYLIKLYTFDGTSRRLVYQLLDSLTTILAIYTGSQIQLSWSHALTIQGRRKLFLVGGGLLDFEEDIIEFWQWRKQRYRMPKGLRVHTDLTRFGNATRFFSF